MSYKNKRSRVLCMLPHDQDEKLEILEKKHKHAARVYARRGINYAECNGEIITLETVGQRSMRFASAGITGSDVETNLTMADREDIIPFIEWAKEYYSSSSSSSK